jgi:hypothetical protein
MLAHAAAHTWRRAGACGGGESEREREREIEIEIEILCYKKKGGGLENGILRFEASRTTNRMPCACRRP